MASGPQIRPIYELTVIARQGLGTFYASSVNTLSGFTNGPWAAPTQDSVHPATENTWPRFPPGGPWSGSIHETISKNTWPYFPVGESIQIAPTIGTNTDSTIEYIWQFFPESIPVYCIYGAGMGLEDCPDGPLTIGYDTRDCIISEREYTWRSDPELMQGMENEYLRSHLPAGASLLVSFQNVENIY